MPDDTDAQLLASGAPDGVRRGLPPARARAAGLPAPPHARRRGRGRAAGRDVRGRVDRAAGASRTRCDGSAAPWLFGIARNQAAMHARRGSLARSARERIGMPVRDYGAAAYDEAEERLDGELLAPQLGQALGRSQRERPPCDRAARRRGALLRRDRHPARDHSRRRTHARLPRAVRAARFPERLLNADPDPSRARGHPLRPPRRRERAAGTGPEPPAHARGRAPLALAAPRRSSRSPPPSYVGLGVGNEQPAAAARQLQHAAELVAGDPAPRDRRPASTGTSRASARSRTRLPRHGGLVHGAADRRATRSGSRATARAASCASDGPPAVLQRRRARPLGGRGQARLRANGAASTSTQPAGRAVLGHRARSAHRGRRRPVRPRRAQRS